MKFSNNTIIVDDYPEKDRCLLFNTRTQAMVKISRELREIIDSKDFPLNFPQRMQYAEELSQLHKMGIVVGSDEEDLRKLKSFFRQLKYGVDTSSLAITILTTYACNFQCTYCFQESSRVNVKMDAETSEHVMSWIKTKLERFGYEQLYIVFYGGEPLVNKPILEKIAAHMKSWCEERRIRFKFMLQTNGYLMTPECVESYLKLGLDQARVSVDGVGEDHDRNRPLRNGGGTFNTIVKNIMASFDRVKIGISTSYDKEDIKRIERVMDYFDGMGILHKLGRFLFSPIHATLGPKGRPEQIRGSECLRNYEDQSLIEANIKIRALMQKRNLPMKSGLSISACPLTRENAGMTIDPHGHIYKCNSMLGHPEFAVGDVRKRDYNEQHDEFINLDVWKQCAMDCPYLPMCSGGCRFSSFLENKDFKTPACHKTYLDRMVPEFIKHDYQTLMAQK